MKEVVAIAMIFIFLSFANQALSTQAPSCQPIYGGGQTCAQEGDLRVDKKVQNPQNGAFVERLNEQDPAYFENQDITFQIKITNTGNSTLSNITVQDAMPKEITSVQGPGKFDESSHTHTFKINSLEGKKSQEYTLSGKIAPSLPGGTDRVCNLVNQTTVTYERFTSSDYALFCIQRQVASEDAMIPQTTKGGIPLYPAPSTENIPETGPEALVVIATISIGFIGFVIRKKTTPRSLDKPYNICYPACLKNV